MAIRKKSTGEKINLAATKGANASSPFGENSVTYNPVASSFATTRIGASAPKLQFEEPIEVKSRIGASAPKLQFEEPIEIGLDFNAQMSRLQELRRQAAVDLDTALVDRLDKQMQALRASAGQQTVGDRVNDILSSALSSSVGSMVNTAGVGANAVIDPERNRRNLTRLQETLDKGYTTDGQKLNDAQKETLRQSIADLQKQLEKSQSKDSIQNKLYEAADKMTQDSAKFQSQAKQGLGALGQFGVDVAIGGLQLAGDIGLGAVTGLGAMAPIAVRGFGSGAQEARQDGATLGQQMAYGIGSAAVEALTEKLSSVGVVQKTAFGAPILKDIDSMLEGVVAAIERAGKTEAGKAILNRLGSAGVGFLSEGAEEMISGLVNPVLKKATYSMETIDWKQTWDDALYEFLVGGAIGAIGGGIGGTDTTRSVDKASAASYNKNQTTVSPAAAPQVQQMAQEERITRAVNPEAEVLSTGATLYTELGMRPNRAKEKADIVQRLVAGEKVDVKDINKLNLTDKAYRAVFTQLTGVQFPEGRLSNEQVHNLARSAGQEAAAAREATEIQQEQQEKAFQEAAQAQVEQLEQESVAGETVSFSEFMDAYRAQVDPNVTREEAARQYEQYLNDAAGQPEQTEVEAVTTTLGQKVTRAQFHELYRANAEQTMTDDELDGLFNGLLAKQRAEESVEARQGGDSQKARLEQSVSRWRQVLNKTTAVKDVVLDDTLRDNEGAYYDKDTGVIHLNSKRASTEEAVSQLVSHELVHSVQDDARKQLIEDIIGTLGNAEERDQKVRYYQERYQQHENMIAFQQGREAQVIDAEYATEEYAAMLVQEAFKSDEMLLKLTQEKPSLIQQVKQIIDDLLETLKGNADAVAERRELEALQTRFAEALKAGAEQKGDTAKFSVAPNEIKWYNRENNTSEKEVLSNGRVEAGYRDRAAFEGDGTLHWEEVSPGNRRADERLSQFLARMGQSGAAVRREGHVRYGYLPVPVKDYSRYTKRFVAAMEQLREGDFFVHDGEIQWNHAGQTESATGIGATTKGGTIGVNNRADIDSMSMGPENTAAHEVIHRKFNRGTRAALDYRKTVVAQVNVQSPRFQRYFKAINLGYHNGTLNFGDALDRAEFFREFIAYVGGEIYSGEKDLSDMFEDYGAVCKALKKVLGVTELGRSSARASDEKSGAFDLPRVRYSLSGEDRVFHTPTGVEVVQNATDAEYRQMSDDVLKQLPWLRGTGEPLLRHTYDEQGNEYHWAAHEAIHVQVEPYINEHYGTRTSQQWKWWEKPDKDDYPVDYSKRRYSIAEEAKNQSPYAYETLVQKPDIVVTQVPMRTVPTKGKRLNVSEVAKAGREQAELRQGADTQQRVVFIPDLKADVLIGATGARHGLTGNKTNSGTMNTAEVTYALPQVLQNSVAVNEQNPRAESDGEYSYVLFGYARREDGKEYLVKSVVNHFAENKSVVEDVEVYDVLKGIKARKTKDPQVEVFNSVSGSQGSHTGNPAARHPNGTASAAAEVMRSRTDNSAASISNASADTISVAELLDVVKENYPELLPESVREHYGITEPAQNPYARYSIANPELSFADQVDLVRQNKLNELLTPGTSGRNPHVLTNSAVYVAKEPNSLMQELGYGDLAIVVTQDHLRQMMGKREDADGNVVNAHNHQLTPRQVKILPKLLEKPAAVLRAKGRPESLIFVTTEKDYRGRPIIVPIKANGVEVVYDGTSGPAHVVTSMYGRDNFDTFFENAVKQGQLVYYKKERIDPILTAPGYQSSGLLSGIDSGTIVGEVNPVVKDPGQRKYAITPEDAEWYNSLFGTDYTAESLKERLNNAAEEYGTIPAGETPVRDVRMPRANKDGKRVHDTVQTVMEAAATPKRRLGAIETAVADGKLADVPLKNDVVTRRTRAKLRRDGWQKALTDWTAEVRGGSSSADLVAMGAHLINNAGNSEQCSGEQYVELLTDYSDLLHRAGQNLQAARILKKLSPEGKLYGIQQYVRRINDNRAKAQGKDVDPEEWAKEHDIVVDPALIEAYREATDDAERDEILGQIQQNIADQWDATWLEKLNNWRYLAMLGNFRTQVRNLAGNLGYQIPRLAKEVIRGSLEAAFVDQQNRTTSVVRDRATFKAALEDFKAIRDIILNGGKVDEGADYIRGIESKRRIYKNTLIESWRKATNWAMDEGDALFCRYTYADSLARFMAAHHTTWENASEDLREQGRALAIKEAAEATYRDNSAAAKLVMKLKIKNPTTALEKGASVLVEGALPFKKTPANILTRSVEYSPIGLVKSGIDAAQKAKGTKDITGTDIINELAKGITGTGLMVLGYVLAKWGNLVGAGPDDEKEKELWELQGNQSYALQFGDRTYTIDWLAPEAIPLLTGANIAEAAMDEDKNFMDGLTNVMMRMLDPVMEMSMMQGINDLMESVRYAESNGVIAVATDAAWSFLMQYVPTLLGQTERATDGVRRATYAEPDSWMSGDMQYKLGQLSQKIPFVWDFNQIPYIDRWGRTEESYASSWGNALAQFLSPSYQSIINSSEMEDELLRLYEATGEAAALPPEAGKKFNHDNVTYELTGAEYVVFATARGAAAHDMLVELTHSKTYAGLRNTEKLEAVKQIYDDAADAAKFEVLTMRGVELTGDAPFDPQSIGPSGGDYRAAQGAASAIKQGLKDADTGETITNSKGLLIMEQVYGLNLGLRPAEYKKLFEALGVGKTVRGLKESAVRDRLKTMRKKAQ